MKYATVCSGIEAPSVAWESLGWKPVWFSEIEPFPCQVLNHHYPDIPNLGDMTKIHETEIFQQSAFDLLCGGTPCVGFSIAGLRGGLDDPRSQLSLEFIRLAAIKRPRWILWENVPGVLSCNGGRDFATFLGGLTGRAITAPKNGWKRSGIIEGISSAYGVCWRVLDAQYFNVAQRRERVFVVGYIGDWRPAAAVLLDSYSLQRHSPPSRQTKKDVAGTITGSTGRSRGQSDGSAGIDPGHIVKVAPTLRSGGSNNSKSHGARSEDSKDELIIPVYISYEIGPSGGKHIDVSPTLDTRAKDGPIRNQVAPCILSANRLVAFGEYVDDGTSSTLQSRDYKGPTDLIAYTNGGSFGSMKESIVSDTLRGTGGDTGGGGKSLIVFGANNSSSQSLSKSEHTSPTMQTSKVPAVVYGINEEQNIVDNGFGCLKAREKEDGFEGTVAFAQNTRDKVREMNVVGALAAQPGMKQTSYIRQDMVVRRLTPIECARLQGFPDDYLDIPNYKGSSTNKYGGKYGVPDGPRYKALGNSMAVPVMRWIGSRIQQVDELLKKSKPSSNFT